MKSSLLYRTLALVLLMAFSLVLLPKHIIADHDHTSIICHKTQQHFEDVDVECELCDFVLPSVTLRYFYFESIQSYSISSTILFKQDFFPQNQYKKNQPLRGPPIA